MPLGDPTEIVRPDPNVTTFLIVTCAAFTWAKLRSELSVTPSRIPPLVVQVICDPLTVAFRIVPPDSFTVPLFIRLEACSLAPEGISKEPATVTAPKAGVFISRFTVLPAGIATLSSAAGTPVGNQLFGMFQLPLATLKVFDAAEGV